MPNTKLTAGEVIRELMRYYDTTYSLNIAVNDYRRNHGCKNWLVAAQFLLALHIQGQHNEH